MSRKSVRPKRRKHEAHAEHENSERWLVTYADMLTLLMVLFIVMFAMSVVDANKFKQLAQGLAVGFGGPASSFIREATPVADAGAADNTVTTLDPGVSNPGLAGKGGKNDLPNPNPSASTIAQQAVAAAEVAQAQAQAASASKELHNFEKVQQQLTAALKKSGVADAVQYRIDQRGLVVTVMTSSVVFPGERAELLGGGQRILSAILPTLRKLPNGIEVDGHTNQLPGPTVYYPTAWELSTARASSVVRYLIAHGVPASRLTAAGFAGTRPLYPPSDPRAVTRNRRVDIVVLSAQSSEVRALLDKLAN
jgi:chemotaxis protein MotB